MRWNGPTLECHSQTLSTLVFHLTAFVLLTQRGGQCEMIGSPEPIVAMIGEDVILPCHVEPSTNVVSMTLEWARLDLNPRFVHVRRDGVELLLNQNPEFVGRTSLSTQKMQSGDLSLTLSKVRISDEGTYRCLIPGQGSSEVVLLAGAVSPPVVLMGEISNSGLDLHCESSGWYPEPEVLWLDGEGKFLPAKPAKTVKGRDDLYSVSSKVTLERRNNSNITCRVQQKKINQTRETNVQILDVFIAPLNFAPFIGVVIVAALLILSAIFFVLWRMKQRRGDKNPSDKESKKEEEIPFREVLKDEEEDIFFQEMKNKLGEDEKEVMLEVLSFLGEQKQELENRIKEQKTQLEGVDKDLNKIISKIGKAQKNQFRKRDKLESLEQTKRERDEQKAALKKSLESTEKMLKRTSEIITKLKLGKASVEKKSDDLKQEQETDLQQDQVKSNTLEKEETQQTQRHSQ